MKQRETQGKDRIQAVIPEAQGREWGEGEEGGGQWWAGNYQHGNLGPILQGSSKKPGRMEVSIISLRRAEGFTHQLTIVVEGGSWRLKCPPLWAVLSTG